MRSEMIHNVSEGFVSVASSELYYRSIGAGPPVILLHGGPGLSHYYLRPGMDPLADRFALIYYDQRGGGRSVLGNPDKVTIAGGIEDLLAHGVDLNARGSSGRTILEFLEDSPGVKSDLLLQIIELLKGAGATR